MGPGWSAKWVIAVLLVMGMATVAQAVETETGPAIEAYGPVVPVPEGSFNLVPGEHYRVAFDVSDAPEWPDGVNRSIESAARFLNMHARNGIRVQDLELAVVLHGSASAAALTDAAYQAHLGVENGSRALIEALSASGVKFYLCGQSAGFRGYNKDELLPQVQMAVSAMTAHVRLQQEGYRIIPF